MAANWLGLLSMGVFYVIILGTGIWASKKAKEQEKKCAGRCSEVTMVGGRDLNIWVSIFTMTGRRRRRAGSHLKILTVIRTLLLNVSNGTCHI